MIQLHPIPAFNDNYIWAFRPPGSSRVWVVDPGDDKPVQAYLDENQLDLAGILVTHHHADHIGGIDSLYQRYQCPVYGPASERIPQVNISVDDSQPLHLTDQIKLQVIHTPGHTIDHICYFFDADQPVLFCGDTLFAGGCGRIFEGTASQMLESLQTLAALPADTRVCCAHEYTLSNLRFALQVDPDNPALRQRNADVAALRQQGLPSLPSTLGDERLTNPFLRCGEPALKSAAQSRDPLAAATELTTFSAIRQWKNEF